MKKLELGLHFYPSDVELLLLLKRRIQGDEHPSNFVIERDLYGPNATPWYIFEESDPWEEDIVDHENKEKKVLHVFTKLCNLSTKKITRTAGCGTWSGQTKGKNVTDKKSKKILGQKKVFTYEVKKGSSSKVQGHWNMYEYSLAETKTDFVICKIIMSRTKSSQEESVVVLGDDCKNLEEEDTSRPRKKLKQQSDTNSTIMAATSDFVAVQSTVGAMELPNVVNIGDRSMTNSQVYQDSSLTGSLLMEGQNDEEALETIHSASWDINAMVDCNCPQAESLTQQQFHGEVTVSNQNVSSTSFMFEHSEELQIGSDVAGSNLNAPFAPTVTEKQTLELQNSVDYGEGTMIYQETEFGSYIAAVMQDVIQNSFIDLNSTRECMASGYTSLHLSKEQQLESCYEGFWLENYGVRDVYY